MSSARYDGIAEWYIPWVGTSPGLACATAVDMVPSRLDSELWLDVACGAGRTSRELAQRGAAVVGIDLSERLIAIAREYDAQQQLGVTFRVADIVQLADWWNGVPFDGAICEMAFMDIDDFDGTVAAVSRALRAHAGFVVSLLHPCFPGNAAGLSSWPPDLGYAAEGYWTSKQHNPEGVRLRVGSSHRTLATYLNTFVRHGFALERVHEAATDVPTKLVLALRRTH